jgi:hypothetical protein
MIEWLDPAAGSSLRCQSWKDKNSLVQIQHAKEKAVQCEYNQRDSNGHSFDQLHRSQ